mmetsp:Transcript_13128/g.32881  ORF Transcript_13128/g.32881 Transcript_13128/m.32881 type:complete len:250 (+) Transcript_13128:733-1482(+)
MSRPGQFPPAPPRVRCPRRTPRAPVRSSTSSALRQSSEPRARRAASGAASPTRSRPQPPLVQDQPPGSQHLQVQLLQLPPEQRQSLECSPGQHQAQQHAASQPEASTSQTPPRPSPRRACRRPRQPTAPWQRLQALSPEAARTSAGQHRRQRLRRRRPRPPPPTQLRRRRRPLAAVAKRLRPRPTPAQAHLCFRLHGHRHRCLGRIRHSDGSAVAERAAAEASGNWLPRLPEGAEREGVGTLDTELLKT